MVAKYMSGSPAAAKERNITAKLLAGAAVPIGLAAAARAQPSGTQQLAVVETRFKEADTDHDGTPSLQELKAPQGQALLKLLQY